MLTYLLFYGMSLYTFLRCYSGVPAARQLLFSKFFINITKCFIKNLFYVVLQADAKTIKFREKVLQKGGIWRDIYGIDEKKVANMVREDQVDILVELTGHTANNKLGMMACRPAPVQVCWDLIISYHVDLSLWLSAHFDSYSWSQLTMFLLSLIIFQSLFIS